MCRQTGEATVGVNTIGIQWLPLQRGSTWVATCGSRRAEQEPVRRHVAGAHGCMCAQQVHTEGKATRAMINVKK